mmetsp:Transcript_92385/g.162956  ORF Transcript_92385/g.162956 Transcript_92385/m.162956 type:complete len:149 (+) Transcript_92385:27-473(+)
MSGAAFRHPPPFLNSGDSDGKHKNDVEQKSATASHLTRPCALLGDQKKVVSARADGMHEIVGRTPIGGCSDHLRTGRQDTMHHRLRLAGCRSLCHHSLQRKLSRCSLTTEHHCIGAIPNRVAEVAYLRAGWYRSCDHTLYHLSGSDDK